MRTMRRLLEYALTDFMRSHRYFPALAACVVCVAVAYSAPRPVPVWGSYAFTSGLLFVLSGWMTLAFMGTESPIARDITRTHANGSPAVDWYRPVAAFAVVSVLAVLAVVFPWLVWVHGRLPHAWEIPVALAVHLGAGTLGTGLALNVDAGLTGNLTKAWGGLALAWTVTLSQYGLMDSVPKAARKALLVLPPMNPLFKAVTALDTRGVAAVGAALAVSLACLAYGLTACCLYVNRSRRA